jgi:hypothetical protein
MAQEIRVDGGYPHKVVVVDGYSGIVAGGVQGIAVDPKGSSARILVTPTLTVHATYVANDYVGTSGVCMRFPGAARVNGGTGYVQSCIFLDYALQQVPGKLWLFDDAVTPPNDSAAFTISDADMAKWIGTINYSSFDATAANAGSKMDSWPIGFKCAVGSMDLFGCFQTLGAPAYNNATGDIAFKMVTLQD